MKTVPLSTLDTGAMPARPATERRPDDYFGLHPDASRDERALL